MSIGDRRIVVDWGKLAVTMTCIASATILGVAGVISETTVSLVLGTAMGYTIGNGRLASSGGQPRPMIGSEPVNERRRS